MVMTSTSPPASSARGAGDTMASLTKVLVSLARVVQSINADDESRDDRKVLDDFLAQHEDD